MVLDIMIAKEHLTLPGLLKIVTIKSFFPGGLSELLLNAFPSLPFVSMPEFLPSADPLDFHWIAGFVNADGSFTLGYTKSRTHRLGATCNPRFIVTQHKRDEALLNRIESVLGCGKVYGPGKDNCLDLRVSGLSIISNKIVPFFTSHPLHGAKALDFADFCKGGGRKGPPGLWYSPLAIMNDGGHLTEAGLNELRS
jgi:hypothetical protein